jgi:hypothetical protein
MMSYSHYRAGEDDIRIDDFFEASPNKTFSKSVKKTQNS